MAGGTGLLSDRVILEMKFRNVMPALFTQMLEEFQLHAEKVSKYHLALTELGEAAGPDRLLVA